MWVWCNMGKTSRIGICSVCPYKVQHYQEEGFILARVVVMCLLIVFFTSLVCSGITQARPSGEGREVDYGAKIQDNEWSQKQEDKRTQIQEELKETMKELELAEQLAEAEDTRESRGLLKKVAFLAGMRVGGLVQSSGTLAASNSLRVFGKVVNSALSVSYGNIEELNSIPEIEQGIQVLPGRPIIEEGAVKVVSVEEKPVSYNIREIEEEAHKKIKANFLKSHNELVERANANSKFLRVASTDRWNRDNKHFESQT